MAAIALPDLAGSIQPPYCQIRHTLAGAADTLSLATLQWANFVRITPVGATTFVGPQQDPDHPLTIPANTPWVFPIGFDKAGGNRGGSITLNGTGVVTQRGFEVEMKTRGGKVSMVISFEPEGA
jgi:hypothetical protein